MRKRRKGKIMNTFFVFNASNVKSAPAHSFHPNASLSAVRKGYVAVNHKDQLN